MGEQLQTLDSTAAFLRGRANRHAWLGLIFAIAVLVLATLLVCLYNENGRLSLDGLIRAQAGNPALWALDLMPLLFMIWGQYVGAVMAYQAGALVQDETRALREQATILQYRLGREAAAGETFGLPNRQAMLSELDRIVTRRGERGGSAALLVVSSPQQLEIQQSQGEEAARELAAQVAERLQHVLSQDAFLAWLGQDGFGILLPRLNDEAEPRKLATRLQLALDTPLVLGGQPTSVRVVIGIALYPAHGPDAEALLRHAQIARYAAAHGHRDWMLYHAGLESAQAEIPRLTADLHAALAHKGLGCDYQLQLAPAVSNKVRLRAVPYWDHPHRGRLQAAQFLHLPGRMGVTHALLLWQLEESLDHLARWRRRHPQREVRLVLTLPDAALGGIAVADTVSRMLSSHDLPGAALVLEITPQALAGAASGSAALSQICDLRALGVSLCLDGVGLQGGSPAAALEFPINELRLPPELIQRALREDGAGAVVESFGLLAKRLRLGLVIAGIDSEAAHSFALRMGADQVEGEIHGPRLNAEAVGDWLSGD
ncbi:MAG TPA: EAL domain-containing protein [Nevskiaceae bacterium]|nr:EAL domain-containing protein [Nevskiaceae bacterium]